MLASNVHIRNRIGMYAERIDARDFAGIDKWLAHAAITVDAAHARSAGAPATQACSVDLFARR